MQVVRVGMISPSVTAWPLYVATDRGFAHANNLNLSTDVTHNSTRHLEALLSGQFDVGHQLADHVIRSTVAQQGIIAFIGIDRPVAHLIVRPSIKDFRDLKGGVLGVDGTKTGLALVLRRMLRANGLNPQSDLLLKPIGGTDERFASLRLGEIDGTLLEAPKCFAAFELGLRELARSTTYLPDYQGTVEACAVGWSVEHRELLIGYVQTYVQSLDWLHDPTNRDEAIEILGRHLALRNQVATASYDEEISGGRFNEHGLLRRSDLNGVVKLMKEEGDFEPLPSATYYDPSYFQLAHSSTRRLTRPKPKTQGQRPMETREPY